MNTNYDKELLLDFIEWLCDKYNAQIVQEAWGDGRVIPSKEVLEWVDQYLEDDE